MLELSKKLKLDILKAILTEKDLFGTPENDENIIKFLDNMMNLKTLPSQDPRYNNAYDDAFQHIVNNYDWEYDYVLTERFNIVDNTETFIEFLNRIIHPNLRKDEDEIIKYLLLINPYLEKEKLSYSLVSFDENGLSIYEINTINLEKKIPSTIIENKIPFIIETNPKGWYDNYNSHKKPEVFPSFVLVNNTEWNDYSNFSTYYLFYYTSALESQKIGTVKIINKNSDNTFDILTNTFYLLNENFCSLGQEYSFYENLKNIFKKEYDSILWALKDAAIFPEILEDFENDYYFNNSLIRYDEQEQLLREVKYRLYDYNLKNLYSFKYSFKPKFSDEAVDVHFDFDNKKTIPSRIFALIGKNGTGKTQLITSLPLDIYKKHNESFTPKTPLFSKVIAVSYSAFDTFEIPKKNR